MLPQPAAQLPAVERRHDLLDTFLSDAAHVGGGFAEGIAFPRTAGEVAAIVAAAPRVLPIGAQSSLTGGATPRGELLIGTRHLTEVAIQPEGLVRVGAGVPLKTLQQALASQGLFYPPAPTFDGAFIGGTVATNAAGAATFKYGSTRRWVQALTVVLADGGLLKVTRGETIEAGGRFELQRASGAVIDIPLPAYSMPDVPKLSAGYFARPGMDAIDLFIGSEGTLGVIVDATLRTVAAPRAAVVLIACASDDQAIALTGALRDEAADEAQDRPLDVSAVEYMDGRSLAVLSPEVFARAGIPGSPRETAALLLVQIELQSAEPAALAHFGDLLARCGVESDPVIALPGDSRTASRLFELREAIPAAVNQRIATAQTSVDRRIEKTAGDFIVPFDRTTDALRLYRSVFERERLNYAIWGHLSDGNLHPNVMPESLDDLERGRAALLELARAVVEMGGAPLAEHGVGRSALKQQMLRSLYGDRGIDEMRAVKRALDPTWKLSPGVLFPAPTTAG